MAMDIPLPSLLLNTGENGGGEVGGSEKRRELDCSRGGGGGEGEERGERSRHQPNLHIQTNDDGNGNSNINEFYTKIDDSTNRNFINVAPGKNYHNLLLIYHFILFSICICYFK
jgi:hypothetical protein